ncbi:hypothetical protein MD484_g5509, partial [Candolleomyces efflorescens]
MEHLLVRPLRKLQKSGLDALPHVILIDGLDMCQGEDRQTELLSAIHKHLLADDSPFRILITSRPELAIRTALEEGGVLHGVASQIHLNDEYDATDDMRRFLLTRFRSLSKRAGGPDWFTKNHVETLVQAGSGQFIYVATVSRYISEPRALPTERLKAVLDKSPPQGQTAPPFELLDKLYVDILSTAKTAYEAIYTNSTTGRGFLLLLKLHHFNHSSLQMANSRFTKYLFLEAKFTDILFSDLHSLVSMKESDSSKIYLRTFHRSFFDFLNEESRAKTFFVPLADVYSHLVKCCLRHILQSPKSDVPLEEVAHNLPRFLSSGYAKVDDDLIHFTREGGWEKIDSVAPQYKSNYSRLLKKLGPLTEGLKDATDVVQTMSGFFEKWKREYRDAMGMSAI